MPDATTGALPHGCTIAKLQEYAHAAASGGDTHDAAVALGAIAEALYQHTAAPAAEDLIEAGRAAIRADAVTAVTVTASATADPAEQVVETHAVSQIWAGLSRNHRKCLHALADAGDLVTAAAATGIPLQRFTAYVEAARRRARQMWHEGDSPAPGPQQARVSRLPRAALHPVMAGQVAS